MKKDIVVMERTEKLSYKYHEYKEEFEIALSEFAKTLAEFIAFNGDWTVKGFIRVLRKLKNSHIFDKLQEKSM